MSSYVDETYDIYDETWRRAIKPHVCDACDRTVAKGERYARVFWLFDGRKEAIVRCVGCQTIHEHLRTLQPGEMWPDERLNCGEEYTRHWGKEPPPLIAALAFASPDEARRISELIRFRVAAHTQFARARYRADYLNRTGRAW